MLSLGTDMTKTAPDHWAGAVSVVCAHQRTGSLGSSSAHGAGELLAGPLAGSILDRRCFTEGQLQAAQTIAQWASVMVADHCGRTGDKTGKCGDELAGLIKVLQLCGRLTIGIFGQTTFDCGSGHQVHGRGCDDLDCWNFGDVAGDIGNRLCRYGIFRTHNISLT